MGKTSKKLTAGKETEGQWQLLMFESRKRRTKSRKVGNITHPLSKVPGYATVIVYFTPIRKVAHK